MFFAPILNPWRYAHILTPFNQNWTYRLFGGRWRAWRPIYRTNTRHLCTFNFDKFTLIHNEVSISKDVSTFYKEDAQICRYIRRAYNRDGYHNQEHLKSILTFFPDDPEDLTFNTTSLSLAILFHDAIYEPDRVDNEERSARLAYNFLKNSPYHDPHIYEAILDTKHIKKPHTFLGRILCDLDLLSMFNMTTKDRELSVRQEYKAVPLDYYIEERIKILERFLDRSILLYVMTQYENQFRSCIQRSINFLKDSSNASLYTT